MTMQLNYLVRGLPGHPLHPPLTAISIGAYTSVVVFCVLYFAGSGDPVIARATGILLHVGIFSSLPAAITGFIDWWRLPRHTPTWRTGLLHMIVTFVATVMFIVTSSTSEEAFKSGVIPTRTVTLVLLAYAVLAFGGWLGGKLVFVFGYRVLPAEAAASENAPPR
jgi:uncharacterized membrane protein